MGTINMNTNYKALIIIGGAAGIILGMLYINTIQDKIKSDEMLAREKIVSQENLAREKKNDYYSCMADAQTKYVSRWNGDCKLMSLNDNCSLATYRADRLEKLRKESEDRCAKLL